MRGYGAGVHDDDVCRFAENHRPPAARGELTLDVIRLVLVEFAAEGVKGNSLHGGEYAHRRASGKPGRPAGYHERAPCVFERSAHRGDHDIRPEGRKPQSPHHQFVGDTEDERGKESLEVVGLVVAHDGPDLAKAVFRQQFP